MTVETMVASIATMAIEAMTEAMTSGRWVVGFIGAQAKADDSRPDGVFVQAVAASSEPACRLMSRGLKKALQVIDLQGFPIFWWLFTDSNRGPVDYDSIALTD